MDIEKRIQLVEQGLRTKIKATNRPQTLHGLAERMAHYVVPGVSIAVVDGGRIAWARGYGQIEAGRPDPVTPETLFQAASISKPVTALAVMALVQAGVLDLDADVNTYLRSWQVPAHEWMGQEEVTLRRLLSHAAGMSVPGFPGYAHDAPVPTLLQVLDGAPSMLEMLPKPGVAPDDRFADKGLDVKGAPPANTAPVRVILKPGSQYAYSGGGYAVVQQLLEDVTGRPFAQVLAEMVLRPAGMARSAFGPLPPEVGPAAATGHRVNGDAIPGRWHTYPELAAAGLWTTPSDLARFALALRAAWAGAPLAPQLSPAKAPPGAAFTRTNLPDAKGAPSAPQLSPAKAPPGAAFTRTNLPDAKGAPNTLLAQPLAREMLRRQLEDEDLALGPIVFEDGERFVFGHGGSNEGYRCMLWLIPPTGQGVAVMTNSDNGWELAGEIVRAVAAAYAWPPIRSFHVAAQQDRALVDVDPARYGPLVGTYRQEGEFHPSPEDPWAHETIAHVTVARGRLQAWLEGQWGGPEELLAESASRYVTAHGYTLEFSPAPPSLRITDPWGDTVTVRREPAAAGEETTGPEITQSEKP